MERPEKAPTAKPRFKRWFGRRPGYGALAAVAVVVFTYIFSQVFAATAVAFGAAIFGYDPERALADLTASTELQFAYILIVEAVTLYILWLFLKARAVPWRAIGLGRWANRSDIKPALATFAVYFVTLVAITAVLQALVPSLDIEQEQQLGFENVITPLHLVMVFISLVILPPLVEEILVRGFLYTGLRARFTKVTSALLASVIFGIAHLQLGSGEPPLWVAAVDTAVLSLFLIYLREKTGSLWAGIIVHGLKNGLAFTVLFVVKWV